MKVSVEEIYLSSIAKFFPGYTPRSDFEIVALATWARRPPNPTQAQIDARVAQETRVLRMSHKENTEERVRKKLEQLVEPTGVSGASLSSVRSWLLTWGAAQAHGGDEARLHTSVAR